MINEKIEILMLNFLIEKYPISKMKINTKHFKRVIIINNNKLQLNKKSHLSLIKDLLIKNLSKVFGYSEKNCKSVLDKFL